MTWSLHQVKEDIKSRLVTLGSRILILEALILQLAFSLFPDLPSESRSTRATITT